MITKQELKTKVMALSDKERTVMEVFINLNRTVDALKTISSKVMLDSLKDLNSREDVMKRVVQSILSGDPHSGIKEKLADTTVEVAYPEMENMATLMDDVLSLVASTGQFDMTKIKSISKDVMEFVDQDDEDDCQCAGCVARREALAGAEGQQVKIVDMDDPDSFKDLPAPIQAKLSELMEKVNSGELTKAQATGMFTYDRTTGKVESTDTLDELKKMMNDKIVAPGSSTLH